MAETLFDGGALRPIPPSAAAEYEANKAALAEFVDRAMDDVALVDTLIGQSPREVMYSNHHHHADFISTVLQFSEFSLLASVVPWVYNSYHARGFSYDYFPTALNHWKRAVRAHLSHESWGPVLSVYDWMLAGHAHHVTLAQDNPTPPSPVEGRWRTVRSDFQAAMLEGDTRKARQAAEGSVHNLEDVGEFYLEVLQPVMVEIGRLWQQGDVSVAQEHLATSIAGRAMASFYSRHMARSPTKGLAVITSAPNEFHELGARMVADFLEMDGWDTEFLGANTPAEDLIKLLVAKPHQLLAISVMMPFNLDRVARLVQKVRAVPQLSGLKIMLGGGALRWTPTLEVHAIADGWANDPIEAVALANRWYPSHEPA